MVNAAFQSTPGIAEVFPVGTTVRIYDVLSRRPGEIPTGQPLGEVIVTNGGITVDRVPSPNGRVRPSKRPVVAYAEIRGEHRYVSFHG